jgi:predicted NAD/FAD-binding protein
VRIAIVGSGIAGLTAAHRLHPDHDITLFEAGSHVGGHVHTHDVTLGGRDYRIDTGFIVFNDWTYPHFIALLDELGVGSQASDMGFSVSCGLTGLEYNGSTFNSLFAQRANLLKPRFWGMLRDILRFNREAPELLAEEGNELSLGDYLTANAYGRLFRDYYILPMGAAIWSTDPQLMLGFPARFFIRFFLNHGLLAVKDRPIWRVVTGGSRSYVDRLIAPFRERMRLNCPVTHIERQEDQVILHSPPAAPKPSTPSSSPATATRPWPCWETPARRSGRSSPPSPTSPTKRCCTPIPACCRAGRWPGRPGITSCPRAPAGAWPSPMT